MSSRRSSARGEKHSRDAAGADAPDAEGASAAKRHRSRPASGALADVTVEAPLVIPVGGHPDEKKRAVFDLFDIELLRTWMLDHSDWKTLLSNVSKASRGDLLDALVLGTNPPKGKSKQEQLSTMQAVWARKRNKAAAGAPGFHAEAASPGPAPSRGKSPKAHAEADASEETMEPDGYLTPGEEEEEEERSPPPSQAAARNLQSASKGAAAARSFPAPEVHSFVDGCMTCLLVPSASAVSLKGAWSCLCGLRGDLPIDSPVNVHLAKIQLASKAAAAALSSDGQPSRDTSSTEQLTHMDKLEKHLARLLDHYGEAHPLFGSSAPAPTPAEALRTSRLALGASQTEMPSQQLLKLIQAGKLLDIAFALPRPFFKDAGSLENATTISFGAGGTPTVNTTKDPTKPQPLASVDEFCMALFSTILPALIDRPAAMIEWIALARTALEVKALHGWPAAMHYTEALLRERICTSAKEGFAKPSDSALRDVQRGKDPHSGGQRSLGGKTPQQQRTCHDYQRGSCHRPNCAFTHTCAVCGGAHGASQNQACSKLHHRGSSVPGSGGNKDRRGGGGSRPPPASGGAPAGASSVKTGGPGA